jgi:hypothetical protein
MMMLPYLEMAEEAFAADKKQPWYQAAAAALDVSDAHVGLPPTPDQLMHHPQIAPDGLLRERVQQPLPPAPRTSLGKMLPRAWTTSDTHQQQVTTPAAPPPPPSVGAPQAAATEQQVMEAPRVDGVRLGMPPTPGEFDEHPQIDANGRFIDMAD